MYNQYYYFQLSGDVIYLEFNNIDKGIEINFYFNKDIVDKHFHKISDGLKFKHELNYNDMTLNLESSVFKAKYQLIFDGKKYDLKKIKKKELKKLLSGKNIYNTINPTKKEIQNSKFKISELLYILAFLSLALMVEFYVQDLSRFYQLITIVPCLIGGFFLWKTITKHFPILNPIKNLFLGSVAINWIIVKSIASFIF